MQIRTFDFNNNKVTTLLDKDSKIWFVASEICKRLGYSNTSDAIKNHCISKGIANGYTLTEGGKQKSILIDEPNLYRLVMRSKIDSAIGFQDWVCEEVLPTIRKTGKYEVPSNVKKISTENRNALTDMWKEHGVKNWFDYRNLTLEEYKVLFNDVKKRKDSLTKHELLLLNALESMEMLNLSISDANGYKDCKESLSNTAKQLPIDKIKEIA